MLFPEYTWNKEVVLHFEEYHKGMLVKKRIRIRNDAQDSAEPYNYTESNKATSTKRLEQLSHPN